MTDAPHFKLTPLTPELRALRSARTRLLEAIMRLETERSHDARPLIESAIKELCLVERVLVGIDQGE